MKNQFKLPGCFLNHLLVCLGLAFASLTSSAQCYFHQLYTYDESNNNYTDHASRIIETYDNSLVAVGYTANVIPTGGAVAWLLDPCGNTLWTKAWDFSSNADPAWAVTQTTNGEIVIAGGHFDGHLKSYLFKTNYNGDSLWFKSVNAGVRGTPKALFTTLDGGFVIGGYFNVDPPDHKLFLLETDSLGNIEWQQEYGKDTTYNYLRTIDKTNAGGYVLSGWIEYDYSPNVRHLYIIKTDANGNQQWKKLYNGWYQGYAISTLDGGYMIVGNEYLINQNDYNAIMIKTDNAGNVQWEKRFRNPDDPSVFVLVKQMNDGSYITGGSIKGSTGQPKLNLMKFKENGTFAWSKIYSYYGTTTDHDYISDMIIDHEGNIVVTGYVIPPPGFSTGNDMFILKVDSTGSLLTSTPNISPSVIEPIIYPNPVNQIINIKGLGQNEIQLISIMDLSGQIVMQTKEQSFSVVGLSSGLYFANIHTMDGRIIARKFIRQ